jgi:hypothetical protein
MWASNWIGDQVSFPKIIDGLPDRSMNNNNNNTIGTLFLL